MVERSVSYLIPKSPKIGRSLFLQNLGATSTNRISVPSSCVLSKGTYGMSGRTDLTRRSSRRFIACSSKEALDGDDVENREGAPR